MDERIDRRIDSQFQASQFKPAIDRSAHPASHRSIDGSIHTRMHDSKHSELISQPRRRRKCETFEEGRTEFLSRCRLFVCEAEVFVHPSGPSVRLSAR